MSVGRLLEKLSPKEEEIQMNRVVRSRCQMLMAFPFFGILSLKLQLEVNYEINTAATDGEKLYINPNFVKTLSEAELNWLVVHEVMHPALQHLWRKGDRLADMWNEACDYAIHDIMMQFKESSDYKKSAILEMPKGGLYNKEYRDMSADQIYDDLRKKRKKQNAGSGNSSGSGGGNQGNQGNQGNTLDDHSKWGNKQTQKDAQQKSQSWEGNLISAAQAAASKSAGNVPGFLERLIGKLTKPQKDWRSLLAEFVEPEINDYSFNPPDKRMAEVTFGLDAFGNPIEVLLPDFNDEVEVVKKIFFVSDTSGSIGNKELETVYSEIVGAIQQFQGKLSGHLMFFDHCAYPPTSFESIDDVLKIRPVGGGGTDFHAPFEYINEHFEIEDVAGIVMLTDGYASWPDESIAKGIPVLWLITNEDQTPPWGLHTTLKI